MNNGRHGLPASGIDRRMFVAGLTAAALPMQARATVNPAAFAGLRSNAIAKTFQDVGPETKIPATKLAAGNGTYHNLSEFRGRPILVALWAEWCVPCLVELSDLNSLCKREPAASAHIVAILTGSQARFDGPSAARFLRGRGIDRVSLLVEERGGDTVLQSLASHGRFGPDLPSSVVLDRQGRIRGRSSGLSVTLPRGVSLQGGIVSEAAKAKMLGEGSHTAWAGPDGVGFIRALVTGELFGKAT